MGFLPDQAAWSRVAGSTGWERVSYPSTLRMAIWPEASSAARGARVVISQHPRRARPRRIDAEIYKWRYLIENFFGKLKEFERIALRACKTDASFAAMIYAAATILNSK